MSDKQHTLKDKLVFVGKGLHTGAETRLTLHPAEPGNGYTLRVGRETVRLTPGSAAASGHRTTISGNGFTVHTVEHILAVLLGMGVDNAVLEVEGGEVPGLDGSAKEFADKVEAAGLVEQDAERRRFKLRRPVSVARNGASIMVFPSRDKTFRVTYILDYPESSLAQGTFEIEVTPAAMRSELAPCRTFVMRCHAEAMLEKGVGQGANTSNTLVLDGDRVIDNELRFPDECTRHKILDLIGDLATLGRPLALHVVAYKSGHTLNLELAQALSQEIFRAEHPKGLMDIRQIESVLPHRYPFLLVDRVLEIEPRRRILAYKNVTRNEEFFQGHFPGQPIMPGVLQIEALAQTGGVLMMGDEAGRGKLAVLMGMDGVKFRRPVVPGDKLVMEVKFEKFKGRIGLVAARATVDGEVVTEVKIKFALVDPEGYT